MNVRTSAPQRIIWITTDHLRYDNIAANGNPAMVTPVLDALVAGGVNFHQCYAQNPLCMASRCSFMTGLYPQQTGVTENGFTLPDDFTPSVARLFSAGGYQTAQIGKLHFQPHEDLDFEARPRNTYGFDTFWCSEERGNYFDPWFAWLTGKYPEHATEFRCPRSSDPARHEREQVPRIVDAPWQASHSGWIVDAATRYLSSRKDSLQFLHLGFYNPHPPLMPTREAWDRVKDRELPRPRIDREEWRDKPQPLAGMMRHRQGWSEEDFVTYNRAFAALVTEVDLALGALVGWLRDRKLLDDTLLVFTSDHGDMCGEHAMTHKGPHFFDGVMHVPLVFHWPAGLGGVRRDVKGLMEMVDILPTMLGLCGAHVPGTVAGRDLSAALRGNEAVPGRDSVYAYHGPGWAMLRTERHKYIRYGEGAEVLYDYGDERAEVVNHAADAARAGTLAELRERMLGRTLAACVSPRRRTNPY